MKHEVRVHHDGHLLDCHNPSPKLESLLNGNVLSNKSKRICRGALEARLACCALRNVSSAPSFQISPDAAVLGVVFILARNGS